MNNVCVCVCSCECRWMFGARRALYLVGFEHRQGENIIKKVEMPMCREHTDIPYCTSAIGLRGKHTHTHSTAQQRQHYFTRNTIAKRYQTISLKLLTFPISLISLSSITGCGSSSAFFHNRAPEKCTSEWDGAGWRAASVAERVRESEKNGKRANEYHGHIWTSEWKFCK